MNLPPLEVLVLESPRLDSGKLQQFLKGAPLWLCPEGSSRGEFAGLAGAWEVRVGGNPKGNTVLTLGPPEKLAELEGSCEDPLPVAVLLAADRWGGDLTDILQSERFLVLGVLRGTRLLQDPPDPEEWSALCVLLKDRIRRVLRPRLPEEALSKPIHWKVKLPEDGSAPGFVSLFADPATRRLSEDLKRALVRLRPRYQVFGRETIPRSYVMHEDKKNPFELRSLAGPSSSWRVRLQGAYRPPSILLLGETGAGKTLAAQWVATQMGEPLAPINLGALLPKLAYGELFGTLKGAFTGAEEDRKGFFLEHAGGVVFLDEIGDLNPDCQVQLLDYLDKGEVRPHDWGKEPLFCPCFVVAASNRPLREWARQGSDRFRGDLLERFDAVIDVPSMAQRRQDLRLLVSATLQDQGVNPGLRVERISLDALAHLEGRDFPGNFREFRRVLASGVQRARGEGSPVLCLRHFILGG